MSEPIQESLKKTRILESSQIESSDLQMEALKGESNRHDKMPSELDELLQFYFNLDGSLKNEDKMSLKSQLSKCILYLEDFQLEAGDSEKPFGFCNKEIQTQVNLGC